jgi:hypothetical protein
MREHPRQGLHLGWIPNDPGRRPREFAATSPAEPAPDPARLRAVRDARTRGVGWIRMLAVVGVLALILLGLVATTDAKLSWFWAVAAVVAIGCWFPAAYLAWAHRRAAAGLRRDNEERAQRYVAEVAEYDERKVAWQLSEAERVARAPRWLRVAADTGISRLDVFGGTALGRRNMLAGLGWSLLEEHAVIILDLSQERLCDGLLASARQAGLECHDYDLPHDLRATPLLAGLTGDQIANQIVEVLHADDPRATAAGRATDLLVLNKIQRALGADLSMARLHAAIGFLLGDASASGLSAAERDGLRAAFGDGLRREVTGTLIRLAAVIEPLRELGLDVTPRPPARLTCLSLADGPRDVAADLTAALIVQWATQTIVSGASEASGASGSAGFRPAIVVAGADEQDTRHLGRLTTVCERFQVPLVRTFSRLTEESARHLDSRNTAFMRLPTRPEALRAAEHIGMERRFLAARLSRSHQVSQSRTRTFSESVTHSTGSTEGGSVTATTATTRGEALTETQVPRNDQHVSVNVNEQRPDDGKKKQPKSSSRTVQPDSPRPPNSRPGDRRSSRRPAFDTAASVTRFKATTKSESKSQSWEKTEQTSHTKSESRSRTDGVSVGDEITYDLTYEHKVQPETLMDLPDDQMLAPHVAENPGDSVRERRMIALVIDPAVIGSDLVAPVAPGEIPAYEAPRPLVSAQVPDYASLPGPEGRIVE